MEGKIIVIQHVCNEGPGLIRTFFENVGWPMEVIDLSKGDMLPHSLESIAAVVMLGGPMNACEENEYPFLKKEDDFISRLIVEEIPFLGVCLGAQLLAKACQGRIVKARAGEVGWFTVSLTREGIRDSLFCGLPPCLTVFQWHEDTFEIPDGATLLVTGKPCVNQAFRVGQYAYGLQFHMEVTPPMVGTWVKDLGNTVNTGKIIRTSVEKREIMESQASMILSNFQRIVESSLRFKRIIKQYVDDRTWAEKKAICWWELS